MMKLCFCLTSEAVRCGAHRLEYGLIGLPAYMLYQNCFQRSHYMTFFKIVIRIRYFQGYFNAHSSNNCDSPFALHIVLPILNKGSPKGSLESFHSNLGHGLLINKLKYTLIDMMKSTLILF